MAKPTHPIQLFALGTAWGFEFPSSAPFPLKLATWFRIAGIPFEVRTENNPGKGPKKKSPWIVDGDVTLADSGCVIAYCRERYGVDPDAHLTDAQRGEILSWQRLFEDHYHQVFEHALFLQAGGARRLDEFAQQLPPILRHIIKRALRSSLKKQLWQRGLGRHSEQEIVAQGKADLEAVSQFLGDRDYFIGDEPSTLDAIAFGFLAPSIWIPAWGSATFEHARSLDNLVRYCERMRARYFPETRIPSEVAVGEAAAPASDNQPPTLIAVSLGLPIGCEFYCPPVVVTDGTWS